VSAFTVDLQRLIEAGIAQHRNGDTAAAERTYRQVLQLQPQHPDALHLLGVIHGDRDEPDAAIDLIRRALRASPDFPDAHYHLANVYLRTGRFGDAERHLRRAVALRPGHAMAWNNLGGVLLQTQRYGEAAACFDAALKIDPALTSALNNYAIACEVDGRFDDVLGVYDRVLAVDPDNVAARYYRALTLLSRGRLAEGWAEYVWRWRRPEAVASHGRFPYPLWRGEDVRGRGVLVWTEQGPGDEILIATMLPDLVARGANVTLLCSNRMRPLFARAFPPLQVLTHDDAPARLPGDIVFQASVSELGAALRPSLDAFGPPAAFLRPDPTRVATLRRRYGDTRPLVGISWISRNAGLEQEKSLPLAAWRPILSVPGVRFVSLQYGDCRAEFEAVGRQAGIDIVHDESVDPLADLDGFAAQVAAMDLVVSVSNTTVHFAGALGLPTWALVPAARGRHWYWFLGRSDSPWYPALRLYRQDRPGSWGGTVDAIARDLAARVGAR
jgi:Tfp pilus assembly protein PilF